MILRSMIAVLLMLIFMGGHVQAKEKQTLNVSGWSALPIAHEGRIKPIDSFARIFLFKFTGAESVNGMSATDWLAEVVFDPASAIARPVFRINKPALFDITNSDTKFFNYAVLSKSVQAKRGIIAALIEQNETSWTADQTEMMRVYQNYILATQLLRSLTAILPLPANADDLDLGLEGAVNYLDLKKIEQTLETRTKSTIEAKGADPSQYTQTELGIADLSFQLRIIQDAAQNNRLFKILPENFNSATNLTNWLAPWEALNEGKGSPQKAAYLEIWQEMAQGYLNQNQQAFDKAVTAAQNTLAPLELKYLSLEKTYNALHLKTLITSLYFGVFFLLLAQIIFPKTTQKHVQRLWPILKTAFISALILHIAYITFRIIILQRPPVGTLYESMLFVALICAGLSAIFMARGDINTKQSAAVIGAFSGFILLYVSNGLADVDRMPTLVAVLNTNFWLTTHVLCITVGYGFCLIAGLMAHLHLLKWPNKSLKSAPSNTYSNMMIVAVFALLFTSVGTILGGIWADQSWGRFWGWDPKENGALLIVLWLVWLLHSRISGHLKELGFTIGMGFITIIVVLAWFGVNLLNVGLHSYGFIEGIAVSIAAFCAIQTAIIGALYWRIKKSESHEN